jgi:uncharacterized protein YecE (DUF72 family)
MARVLVGLPALQGDVETYKERFDLVEIRPLDTPMPHTPTLRKWRKAAGPAFVFSVVLPRVTGELTPGKALDEALAKALEVAAVVEARCVLLATPASVRPTAQNRKRIAALFDRVAPEGTVRLWEPAGMWERDDVLDTARHAGVLPVFDAAREALAPGPIAYTRLRSLGQSANLGAGTLDRVADRLRKRREAFVVVEGKSDASRVRAALTEALARRPSKGAGVMIIRPGQQGALIAEDEEQ